MSDYQVGDTLYFNFTTRAFATGIPTVLAGTPVISIYEDNSTTQITAGITLTVSLDSVVGLNNVAVVATGGNGFETGKFYSAVITTGTVGGVSVVGEVVKEFSLEASAAALDLANGTDGLGAIKTDTAAILLDTAEIGTAGAGLTNINLPNQTMDITGNITGNLSGSVGSVTGGATAAAQTTAQNDLDIITGASGVNLLTATQASIDAIEVDTGTDIPARFDGVEGATFSTSTDSLEAIRNRGDVAWITGGGGGISDILNIQPLIPNDIDLANTATYRLGMMLINSLDDLPTTAEITPGTISIDRKAIGGTSWTSVISDSACSELAGLIYFDEVFDSGTGYAEGDSIRVTLKSQLITVSANNYEISDSNGRIFYTNVRQTMRGTDSGALASVCTETRLAELDAGNLPTDIAAIPTTAMRGTDSAATEAKQDIIDTNVDAILVDTAQIGVAGAGLTNINLPNQTMDITGNLSGSVGSVTGGATSAAQTTAQNDLDIITGASGVNLLTATQASIDAIEVDTGTTLPGLIDDLAVKKNATFSNFEFLMVLTSDHVTPATGLTVTGQRSIDGGAFATVGGTIAEVSNGIYQFDALAADTNGDVITWRFSSATADDTFVTFKTVA